MTAKTARYINSRTGDYAVLAGGLQGDATIASKVVLALRTRRGSSAVNGQFGSLLHLVSSADEAGARQAKGIAEDAIAHLAAEADELTVDAEPEVDRLGVFTGVIKIAVLWYVGGKQGGVTVPVTV